MRDVEGSVATRTLGSLVGNWWRRGQEQPTAIPVSGDSPLADDRPWHLPAQQIIAANLVFETADSLGQAVQLIDVNRPGEAQSLVARWVGQGGILPLLVRMDGRRLQGIEQFVPKKVRQFIGGP
jgi:hypothetical protein